MTIKTRKKVEVRERDTLASLRVDDANSRAGLYFGETEVFRFNGTEVESQVGFGDIIADKLQLGDTAIDGLLAGAGTSASQYALGATAGTALDFRFSATHTSGDMRGMYLRIDASGAGGSGEALRTFYEIENVSVATGGTVNSHHATLEIDGNSGQVSGAGNVARFTLGGSGTKTLGGTLSGVNIHLDLPSDITLGGGEAAIRLTKTQDHEWPVFAAFDSTVGSGNAIETSAVSPTGNTSHAIHIKVDGTSGYIPVYASAAFGN